MECGVLDCFENVNGGVYWWRFNDDIAYIQSINGCMHSCIIECQFDVSLSIC